MKKVEDLLKTHGEFYVKLKSEKIGKLFMQQAESEGFTFGDGARPTERDWAEIMAVKKNKTINYVGFAGMMKVQCGQANVVDFEKYLKN